MLQGFVSRWSLVLIFGKELRDEVLGLVGDVVPDWVVEGELANLDLFHNFLVRRAIKWWNTGQSNICDDTARPNVALGAVALGKDFWGNVVRSSELFVELLTLINNERGSEINDLNLVELLVLLKEDVLGFQISVHNMVQMTIVDARKNLLHEQGGIALGKLSSGDDLVEQLSALADIGDNVVSLLILEELVHLQDVWVI